MGKPKYDLEKLTANSAVHASDVIRFYYNYQDYYDGLTAFLEKREQFLRMYNPMVVIYSDETRKSFLDDCNDIRAELTRLGMTLSLDELNNLENALHSNDVKSLSDGLVKFFATLDITATDILAACTDNNTQLPLICVSADMPDILPVLASALGERFRIESLAVERMFNDILPSHNPLLFILEIEQRPINGYELAMQIRESERFRSTPILLLTGLTYVIGTSGQPFGLNDYLPWPANGEAILQKVEKIAGIQ